MPDSDQEIFEKVIRFWQSVPDKEKKYTLNQLANVAYGKSSPENSKRVGRVINLFRANFVTPRGYGRQFGVNWPAVQRDHAHLLTGGAKKKPSPPGAVDAFAGIKKALNDELVAIREDAKKEPILCRGASYVSPLGPGSFLYGAVLDFKGDREFPIPEGVRIRLQWSKSVIQPNKEAVLLSYDRLETTIYFETEVPLGPQHLHGVFQVLPCVEELLRGLQGRLEIVFREKKALPLKVLNDQVKPTHLPWGDLKVPKDCLDSTQAAAIEHCLNRDISYLWGPPGTGKTHSLGYLISEAALRGKRVVAAAISNVAVDQVALHLVKALQNCGDEGEGLLKDGKILRFGHARLPEVLAERRLFPGEEEIQRLRKALYQARQKHREIPEREAIRRAASQKLINDLAAALRKVMKERIENARVILTTAVQTCMETELANTPFHLAVIDEASMMSLPYVAAVASLASHRLVISGDFRQLGPIALSRTAAAYDWLHKDPFSKVGIDQKPEHPGLAMLQVQRRMEGRICQLINAPFYGGLLRTATKSEKTRASRLAPLSGEPAICVRLLPEDGSKVELTESGSRRNPKSAELVARLARHYLTHNSQIQVGVITP